MVGFTADVIIVTISVIIVTISAIIIVILILILIMSSAWGQKHLCKERGDQTDVTCFGEMDIGLFLPREMK